MNFNNPWACYKNLFSCYTYCWPQNKVTQNWPYYVPVQGILQWSSALSTADFIFHLKGIFQSLKIL